MSAAIVLNGNSSLVTLNDGSQTRIDTVLRYRLFPFQKVVVIVSSGCSVACFVIGFLAATNAVNLQIPLWGSIALLSGGGGIAVINLLMLVNLAKRRMKLKELLEDPNNNWSTALKGEIEFAHTWRSKTLYQRTRPLGNFYFSVQFLCGAQTHQGRVEFFLGNTTQNDHTELEWLVMRTLRAIPYYFRGYSSSVSKPTT